MAKLVTTNPNQIRMVADNDVKGGLRHDMFAATLAKYNSAMDSEFYLEAITLMESLIGDRLECLIGRYVNKQVKFGTLGSLLNIVRANIDNFPAAIKPIINQIDLWRISRNKALHQMAKISVGKMHETFDQKYELAHACAQKGRTIFRDLDKITKIK